jgi:hypothetical protein
MAWDSSRYRLRQAGEDIEVGGGKAPAGFSRRARLKLELVTATPIEKDAWEEGCSGIGGEIVDELFESADGRVDAPIGAANGGAGWDEGPKRFHIRDVQCPLKISG